MSFFIICTYVSRCGQMWPYMGTCEQMWARLKCGHRWADVGRCVNMGADVDIGGYISADVVRCGHIWAYVGRFLHIWHLCCCELQRTVSSKDENDSHGFTFAILDGNCKGLPVTPYFSSNSIPGCSPSTPAFVVCGLGIIQAVMGLHKSDKLLGAEILQRAVLQLVSDKA